MTAKQVIERARETHPALDEQATPDPVAARFLSRFQRRLMDRIMVVNPDLISADADFPLPFASFDDGTIIPPHVRVRGVELWQGDMRFMGAIIPWHQRPTPAQMPAVWIEGTRLRQAGSETDWQGFTNLRVNYVPLAPELVSIDDPLLLPDNSEDALVKAVASFMAQRTPDTDVPGAARLDRARMAAEAIEAEERFISAVGHQVVRVSQIQEVW